MSVSSLRANALLCLAGAWLLGTVAAAASAHVWWPGVAAIVTAGVVAAVLRLDLRYALMGALAAGLFTTSAYWYVEHTPPEGPRGIAVHNDAAPVRFRALVSDAPELSGRSQRLRLSVREIFQDERWERASGGVLLRIDQFPRYRYGDVLEVTGELETPPTFPDFDYREYLALNGVQSLAAYADVDVIDTDEGSAWKAALIDVRAKLGDALERVLPEPQAALAAGIFAGQRSSIPDDLTVDMNATGTSHLVAVSGQNVAIVAALTISSLAWLIGRRHAALIAIFSIAGYVLLTGASPSVVRAGIMGALFVIATLVGRPASAGASIALAAAIMVGLEPLVVHDISFQLSFAAVIGLVYLAEPFEALGAALARNAGVEPMESRPASFLLENLSITMAAIVATLPLTALHFDRVSIVAPVANLPLVPVFPLILATSGITAIASMFWQPLGEAAAWLSWACLTYMIETVRFFADLPIASTSIDGFGRWHAFGAYSVIAVLAWWLVRRPIPMVHEGSPLRPTMASAPSLQSPLRRGPIVRPVWAIAVVLAIVCTFAWSAAFAGDGSRRLTVSVLDVGQGDAILVETPDGRHALVDGGASGLSLAARLGEELPFWQRTIDLVVLTHPDEDHLGGLIDALERYDVRQVVATSYQADNAVYREWRKLIDAQKISYHDATAGDAIDLGAGTSLRVLSPNDAFASTADSNSASLVMKLTWGNVSFLLTGDIEAQVEDALVRSGVDLKSTVLKVAHHGSATSSSAAFLDAVDAKVAVVSVGAGNPYGHPVRDVIERLDDDAMVLRTDERGTIELTTDGQRVWVETER